MASQVQAGGALGLSAGRDLTLGAAYNTVNLDAASEHLTSEGFMSSTTLSTQDKIDERRSVGSRLGGTTVNLTAGRDLALTGAQVLADQDIHASAARNLSVSAATSTRSAQSHRVENDTGWFSTDLSFGYGTTTTTTDQRQRGSVQSGTQERSLVGSVNGSVTLAAGTAGAGGTAGGALTVSGSDVQAGQDLTASGTRVHIDPGLDRSDATTHTNAVTDAVSVAVGGSVVKAAQALQSLTDSATTRNKRLQALALVAQGLAAAQAAAAAVADGGSISVSLTASHSERTTGQTDTGTSHAGSQLSAGRNVQITATGAGAETGAEAGATHPDPNTHPDNGNITLLGSGITAGRNVALSARQDIRIAAAQDSEAHATEHSDWTVGAGIGASWSSKGGAALGVTANAGVGAATQQSQARTQLNSHVTAGNHLSLDSGRDTTVQGGVLGAERVSAEVGRNLTIASQQDTASASAKSANASVSVTAGYGVSVSASLAYAQSKNDFASVDEQSAIRSGNGGFDVHVTGHTDLQGGALTSTQQAVDAGRNHLTTATLSTRDLANHSTASGIGLSVSASSNTGGSDKDASKSGTGAKEMGGVKLADQGNAGTKMDATSLGAASESDSSTTQSAISGATLTIGGTTTRTDQGEVTTDSATDSSGKPIHTATTGTDTAATLARPASLQDIQAQVKIVQSFGSQAAKAVGDYAEQKLKQADALKAQAEKEPDPAQRDALVQEAKSLQDQWGDTGTARIAAHVLIGGLTGDVGGAVGAAAGTLTAPAVATALQDAGITGPLADVLTAAASTAAGAAVGGRAGAVGAGNEVMNNFMQHQAKFKANVKACKSNPSSVGCGDYAAMTNGTSTAIGKVAGYDVVATVGSDGRPVAYTVGTGDNAMVMQPTDYAAFTKMPAGQQQQLMAQYTQARLNDTSIVNSGFNVLNAQTRAEQASNVRLIVSCPAGDCTAAQLVQGVSGAVASVTAAGIEGALMLVDLAGKSAAIQAKADRGTNSDKDYQPWSAVGQSLNNKGISATASDMVKAIGQLPGNIIEAASNGNSFDTTRYLMDVVLLLDGAASVGKFGVGSIKNAVQAADQAVAEAAVITKAKIENNVSRDDGVDPHAPVPNAQSQTNLRDKAAVDAANGTSNPHYDPKHGTSTTLQQQYDRAMNGTNPQTGAAGRPADASKFFNATDMETAITRAEAAYAMNPTAYTKGAVPVNFNRPVGEGYVGSTKINSDAGLLIGEYRWSSQVTVGIDAKTGKAYTAYPNVSTGFAMPDPLKMGVKR